MATGGYRQEMSAQRNTTADGPDVDDLAAALRVTEQVIAGVRPEQAHLPTPCPEYDVTTLVDHLVGYAANFADKATGAEAPVDPGTVRAGDDALGAFREAADRLVEGYRDGPAEDATPLGVVLIESVTHGWDLATATGQPSPYPDAPVLAALDAGGQMMSPEYRGDDMPFGEVVEVPESAPPLDRLVAFMGRDPDWSA